MMQRRDFLKIGAVGAATVVLPTIALAEPHMHGDSIWEENPTTPEELERCIQKYTNYLFDSRKAYEILHIQNDKGGWEEQQAVHVSYALATADATSTATPERRLVRSMWASIRELILKSEDDTPHLIWRRRPWIERTADKEVGKMVRLNMRLWISGLSWNDIEGATVLKLEGEPTKVIA